MKNNTRLQYLKWQLIFGFNSPLFYITGIIFSVFISINFYIRQRFFTGYGSTDLLLFFSAVPFISIIAIPALCYKKSELIFNDFIPLKNYEKIYLRFISILIQYVCYLLFLIPAALLINLFGTIDYGQLITSIICLIFYGSAIISVTIFIFEIISSSVVSFVVAAVLLAIFNSIHILTTYIPLNSFFLAIVKNISFIWHFDAASKGIIDTRDIVWLLSSTFLFLILAFIVKELKSGKKYKKFAKINIAGYFLLILLIFLNSSNWYWRFDFSKTKNYSLSNYSKEILKNIDSKLNITYYRSNALARIYPQVRDISDYLTTYSSSNKNISYIIVDPDKNDSTKKMLEKYGITSQPFVNATQTSTEYTNVYSAIVIEYNGNQEIIPYILSTETLEYDLDGRLGHLVNGTSRTVNIIVGNGLSLSDDYSYVIPWLSVQGFICNPIFIEDENFIQILEDASGPLLLIGDSEITIEQAIAIESYILKEKGNALLCVSPYYNEIQKDWSLHKSNKNYIVEMLENWGVKFTENIAADASCAKVTMSSHNNSQSIDSNTHTTRINYPLWINVLSQENSKLGINLFWSPELKLEKNVSPYLYTTSNSWVIPIDLSIPESLIETNPFVVSETSYSIDNNRKVIAANITGPLSGLYTTYSCKKSNIIVIPDQYFLNSLMNGYIGDTKNFFYMTNELLKLNNEHELSNLQNKTSSDKTLNKIVNENDLLKKKNITYTIIFFIVPLILILLEVFIIFIQIRKIKNVKKEFIK